jgi:macrolide-specific efflux system membrane fusion protein
MNVSASIITDIKQDVILVSNSAVKNQNGNSYVQIMIEEEPQNKNVEIGISNNTQTEIISGVNVGDEVVIQTINPNSTSNSSSANSRSGNFRLPGMGGMR